MVWKGVILKESLEDSSLLELVKIIKTNKGELSGEKETLTFYNIEVEDSKKDDFVERAIKSIKYGFYLHLVKDKLMYIIFKNHMYKFSKGFPELGMAKEEGRKMGIPDAQMNFESLIENPWA
jgi:hypothetical protein